MDVKWLVNYFTGPGWPVEGHMILANIKMNFKHSQPSLFGVPGVVPGDMEAVLGASGAVK